MRNKDNAQYVFLFNQRNVESYNKLAVHVQQEILTLVHHFDGWSFDKRQYVEASAGLIRAREKFGSKGGSDYSRREASHQFSVACKLKFGLIYRLA